MRNVGIVILSNMPTMSNKYNVLNLALKNNTYNLNSYGPVRTFSVTPLNASGPNDEDSNNVPSGP